MTGSLAASVQARSRAAKWRLYAQQFPPRVGERVLDVGVSRFALPNENHFLRDYPYPAQVTGVGVSDLSALPAAFPATTFVQADGRDLPFGDREFDVVYSNAVVEHVGPLEEQAAFVRELCRVGAAGLVTTPARSFPVESHTRLPLLHWLPREWFVPIAARLTPAAQPHTIWLLSPRRFLSLFPADVEPTLHRGRLLGLTATLAISWRRPQDHPGEASTELPSRR